MSGTSSEREYPGVIQITGGPQSLVMDNKTIVTFKTDGSIELGPDVAPDEAAREFWTFLAHMNPLRGEVTALQAKVEAYREIVQAVAALDYDELESVDADGIEHSHPRYDGDEVWALQDKARALLEKGM